MVAKGFLTTGIYIRTMLVGPEKNQQSITEIAGTFYVGGQANISIFNFYASLYVRLGMTADGDMAGLAIFTFSFSMGLADFKYKVTVKKKQPALGGGGSKGNGGQQAIAAPDGIDRSIITGSANPRTPDVLADVDRFELGSIAAFMDQFNLDGLAGGNNK